MANLLFDDHSKGAIFSECGRYRYRLWRTWDQSKPKITFVGLNPSTANADQNDATIRTVMMFAKQWGYGGVFMVNLFPFISTDPTKLRPDHLGDNDLHILDCASKSSTIVFAWGAWKVAKERGAEIASRFPNAMAMLLNSDGSPHHPLYLPKSIQLIPYKL